MGLSGYYFPTNPLNSGYIITQAIAWDLTIQTWRFHQSLINGFVPYFDGENFWDFAIILRQAKVLYCHRQRPSQQDEIEKPGLVI